MGEQHFTQCLFSPQKLSVQFPGLVQKYRGLALCLPGLVKPLVMNCQALKFIAKKCTSNNLIQSLLAYLFRKGIVRFQGEITMHGG